MALALSEAQTITGRLPEGNGLGMTIRRPVSA
jgi:hypothetical protein